MRVLLVLVAAVLIAAPASANSARPCAARRPFTVELPAGFSVDPFNVVRRSGLPDIKSYTIRGNDLPYVYVCFGCWEPEFEHPPASYYVREEPALKRRVLIERTKDGERAEKFLYRSARLWDGMLVVSMLLPEDQETADRIAASVRPVALKSCE